MPKQDKVPPHYGGKKIAIRRSSKDSDVSKSNSPHNFLEQIKQIIETKAAQKLECGAFVIVTILIIGCVAFLVRGDSQVLDTAVDFVIRHMGQYW